MAPTVRTEDLLDSKGVAKLLGLEHAESVSTYQRRYSDMPGPIIVAESGRCRLWLKQEIEEWGKKTGRLRT